MNPIFENIFKTLNDPANSVTVMTVFLVACGCSLALRVLTCLHYQTNYTLFKLHGKPLKSAADAAAVKYALLKRVMNDYINSAQKNVTAISTRSIVTKHLRRLRFGFWSLDSIERFLTGFENGVILVGLVLAVVFSDYRFLYGLVAVGLFALTRLFAAIFDIRLVREKLTDEITEYVDREAGQFFAGDTGSILLRLKSDLVAVIQEQSAAIGKAMDRASQGMADGVKTAMDRVTEAVEKSMGHLAEQARILQPPLAAWAEALGKAGAVQQQITDSYGGVEKAAQQLEGAVAGLQTALDGHGKKIAGQEEAVRREVVELTVAVTALKEANQYLDANREAVASQLKYVENNQQLLEKSVQQYEAAMVNLTQKLGDGFGSMLDFHIQNAYQSLNDGLLANINKVIGANSEQIHYLQQLFDQMLVQSRGETDAISEMRAQMEAHFAALRNAEKTE